MPQRVQTEAFLPGNGGLGGLPHSAAASDAPPDPQDQSADHHACAERRSQNSQSSFSKELEKISQQHERQRDEEQKDQG